MTVVITHAKVSGKAAPADTTEVGGPDWDAAHTITGLSDLTNASNLTSGTVSATLLPTQVQFVFEGDSLSNISNLGTWPSQLVATNGFFARGAHYYYAADGDTAANMVGEYVSQAGPVALTSTMEQYFFLWAGTNDIEANTSAATIYGYLKSIWASARASGYKVVAFTIGANGVLTAPQIAVSATLNANILSDTTLYDYVVRLDLLLTNSSDTIIYGGDTTHLTFAGNTLVANYVAATILGAKGFQRYSESTAGSANARIENTSTSASAVAEYQVKTNAGVNILGVQSTAAGALAYSGPTGSNMPYTLWANGAERVRIDTSGNVGINGTAPAGIRLYQLETTNITAVDRTENTNAGASTYAEKQVKTNAGVNILGVQSTAAGALAYVGPTGAAIPLTFWSNSAEGFRLLTTGNLQFTNSSNFAVNASVATTMTSVGPVGSHTTVQEWLKIKNASGVDRWIPCY